MRKVPLMLSVLFTGFTVIFLTSTAFALEYVSVYDVGFDRQRMTVSTGTEVAFANWIAPAAEIQFLDSYTKARSDRLNVGEFWIRRFERPGIHTINVAGTEFAISVLVVETVAFRDFNGTDEDGNCLDGYVPNFDGSGCHVGDVWVAGTLWFERCEEMAWCPFDNDFHTPTEPPPGPDGPKCQPNPCIGYYLKIAEACGVCSAGYSWLDHSNYCPPDGVRLYSVTPSRSEAINLSAFDISDALLSATEPLPVPPHPCSRISDYEARQRCYWCAQQPDQCITPPDCTDCEKARWEYQACIDGADSPF